jgi:hypothetical protein
MKCFALMLAVSLVVVGASCGNAQEVVVNSFGGPPLSGSIIYPGSGHSQRAQRGIVYDNRYNAFAPGTRGGYTPLGTRYPGSWNPASQMGIRIGGPFPGSQGLPGVSLNIRRFPQIRIR